MPRLQKDKALMKETAFPAAGADGNSEGIKIGAQDDRLESVELFAKIPENSILADGQTITIKVQVSADDSAYADIPPLGSVVIAGKSGNGLPDADGAGFTVDDNGNVEIRWAVPSGLGEYVRANVALSATAGDLTGLEYEFGVVV